MLAGGAIAVGTVSMLPVGAALAEALVLSGANRWNEGQSELEVVFDAAADTTGVTSFSLGLWGKDPATGQEVALTPQAGTYELIVGASSISMLVGMRFANGLRGPTTRIPVPKAQVRFRRVLLDCARHRGRQPCPLSVVTLTKGVIEGNLGEIWDGSRLSHPAGQTAIATVPPGALTDVRHKIGSRPEFSREGLPMPQEPA